MILLIRAEICRDSEDSVVNTIIKHSMRYNPISVTGHHTTRALPTPWSHECSVPISSPWGKVAPTAAYSFQEQTAMEPGIPGQAFCYLWARIYQSLYSLLSTPIQFCIIVVGGSFQGPHSDNYSLRNAKCIHLTSEEQVYSKNDLAKFQIHHSRCPIVLKINTMHIRLTEVAKIVSLFTHLKKNVSWLSPL